MQPSSNSMPQPLDPPLPPSPAESGSIEASLPSQVISPTVPLPGQSVLPSPQTTTQTGAVAADPANTTPPLPGAATVTSSGFGSNDQPVAMSETMQPAPMATPPKPARSRFLKLALICLAALIILGGGAAITYVAYIAPNEPANVLKAAFINDLQQNSLSETSNTTVSGMTIRTQASVDKSAKAYDLTLNFSGMGTNISLEGRYVGQNLYLRAGDLSSLSNLAMQFDPSLSSTATTLSKDLSNQWFEVNSSFLSSVGIGCYLNTSFASNQSDISLLRNDYAKYPFLTVNQNSSVTVDGQAADKMYVTFNESKMVAFLQHVGNLSIIQSIKSCQKGSQLVKAIESIKQNNHNQTATIWINKATKQLMQVTYASKVSSQTVTSTTTLHYGPVSITPPSGAESVLQLYKKLQPILGGSGGSGLSGLGANLGGLNTLSVSTSSLL